MCVCVRGCMRGCVSHYTGADVQRTFRSAGECAPYGYRATDGGGGVGGRGGPPHAAPLPCYTPATLRPRHGELILSDGRVGCSQRHPQPSPLPPSLLPAPILIAAQLAATSPKHQPPPLPYRAKQPCGHTASPSHPSWHNTLLLLSPM